MDNDDILRSLGVVDENAAIDKVSQACRNAGKPWSAVTFNAQHAEMLISKGCRMLSPTNDIRLAVAGVNAVKNDFAALFAKKE